MSRNLLAYMQKYSRFIMPELGCSHRNGGCRHPLNLRAPSMTGWPNLDGDDLPPSLREHYTRFVASTPVRPSPAHRYFQSRGLSRLCHFPSHRRQNSHVSYKSLIELRAVYMPDVVWAVSKHP